MLGVRPFVLAVNKMDLVGWSDDAFRAIAAQFRPFAAALGLDVMVCIPSRPSGDNVAFGQRGWPGTAARRCWTIWKMRSPYSADGPFRMPVKFVSRPRSDFRGYSGLIASGDA